MISPEAFDKFIQEIQDQIDAADKTMKQKAEDTLKNISDSYRQKVSERIANEVAMAEECRRVGDNMGERHHAMLAEIYKSLFNIQATTETTK